MLLPFALWKCCDFYKLKVCENPSLSKSIGAIFFQQHLLTSFLCVTCHFCNLLNFFIVIMFAVVIYD